MKTIRNIFGLLGVLGMALAVIPADTVPKWVHPFGLMLGAVGNAAAGYMAHGWIDDGSGPQGT